MKGKITKAKLKKLEKQERNKKDKEWGEAVKNRDNNKCVICSSEERLNPHHIISRTILSLRHDIKNGLSLCPLHHNFSRQFSAHGNSLPFIIWLIKNRNEQYEYLKSFCEKEFSELK